jgi:hypothetical protein
MKIASPALFLLMASFAMGQSPVPREKGIVQGIVMRVGTSEPLPKSRFRWKAQCRPRQ